MSLIPDYSASLARESHDSVTAKRIGDVEFRAVHPVPGGSGMHLHNGTATSISSVSSGECANGLNLKARVALPTSPKVT